MTLRVTPLRHLVAVRDDGALEVPAARAAAIESAFAKGSGNGLLEIGGRDVAAPLPPVLAWWRAFAGRCLAAWCAMPESAATTNGPDTPSTSDLASCATDAPIMEGAEYVDADALESLWNAISDAIRDDIAASGATRADYLKSLDPAWNVVGRVHFNLAENRSAPLAPFAFLATYTGGLGATGKAQHLPLGQALTEYAGKATKDRLLSLLVPVQRASERCEWLKAMVASGEIFHPLRWTPEEAFAMLGDAAELERAGVVVRMPAQWKSGRPSRPHVTATIGSAAPAAIGQDALLDFHASLTLDGAPLTEAEVKRLLSGADGLVLLRGQWVEVDRERLAKTLEQFRAAEKLAREGELTFTEAMRLLAGADIEGDGDGAIDRAWSVVRAGPWLAEQIAGLRAPEGLAALRPGRELTATLRPYQEAGVRWLHFCSTLGLGACLADDMGLGKTIQVLALLLVLRAKRTRGAARPHLLVAPASLIANWAAEIQRFAPSLVARTVHPSAMAAADLKKLDADAFDDADLVITTYGSILRIEALAAAKWDLVVLDEAQAIKNPGAKQTRAVKKLEARSRIALTGTPIENRLGDLWSLFDFLLPGLLGSEKEFARYVKRIASAGGAASHAPLRDLVRPYILRRLKTDRSVISDLPAKTEMLAYCALSRRQAALYQKNVEELTDRIADTDGMQRRGLVLSFLMRFKQICNHPSHWLGDGRFEEKESGKFGRLREIAEVVLAKQEKMLVFTQFREITDPLSAFLNGVFGRPGLVLHGATAVKNRKDLVARFQEDEDVPFFVLSLKAGGTGLNLTAASHVVHFDRWWNPAVENQATDRAFRIGQQKNVLVHKFVCRGTVEEKVDALIESKKKLAKDLLEGGAEVNLTELGDAEIMRLVALDLGSTVEE